MASGSHLHKDMLQVVNEVISITAAVSMGLYAFRYMNRFFRLIFAQVVAWAIFYVSAYGITIYQDSQGLPLNNQWVMNAHLLVETVLLIVAAYLYFNNRAGRMMAICLLLVFALVVIIQLSQNGFALYWNYADVAACICLTALYSFLLYDFSLQRKTPWWASPEIFVCLGILIYAGCSVPYIALMHYLEREYPAANNMLFHLINDVLANFRYLLTAFAFWLVRYHSIYLKRIP